MAVYLQYREKEIDHLKRVDKRLAAIIDQIKIIVK